MGDLRQRVEALTGAQRRALAEVLAERSGTVRLRSYVTLRKGAEEIDGGDLKEHLAKVLPAHAVPGTISVLEDIPRLPNGKVDRSALPLVTERKVEPIRESISEKEEILLKIWREVLGVEVLSVHDDFFEVGGDSILSIQVISRARSAGLQIAPQEFTEHPTIAGLVAIGGEESELPPEPQSGSAPDEAEERPLKYAVPIRREGIHLPLFCMHSGGDALLYRGLAKRLGPEFPVYGMQPIGLADDEEPAQSIEAIAEPYFEEIRAIQKKGPYCLLGNCFGGAVGLEIAHRLNAENEEVALLVVVDSAAPVLTSPARGPSIWAAVWERNPGRIWRRFKRNVKAVCTTSPAAITMKRLYVKSFGSPAQRALEEFRAVHKAYVEAFYRYEPAEYHGHVVYFQGTDSGSWNLDFLGGWKELAPGLEVEDFECTHRQFLDEPHVGPIAESLARRIVKASAGHGDG